MSRVLVVADVPWVRNEVHAALTSPDFELTDLDDPTTAAGRALEDEVDAVVVDLQVGAMGGMAVARDVRNHTDLAGAAPVPVVVLLDRAADAFLAKRSGAAAWLVKPFSSQEMRSAMRQALTAEGAPDSGGE